MFSHSLGRLSPDADARHRASIMARDPMRLSRRVYGTGSELIERTAGVDPKPTDTSVRCEVCRAAVECYEPGFAGGDGLTANLDQTQDVISHLTPVFCRVKVAVADSINFLPRCV